MYEAIFELLAIWQWYSHLTMSALLEFLPDFSGGSEVKNTPANAEDTGNMSSLPELGDSLEKEMVTHSSKKSHGQRSLEGYSPWGHKESDTT